MSLQEIRKHESLRCGCSSIHRGIKMPKKSRYVVEWTKFMIVYFFNDTQKPTKDFADSHDEAVERIDTQIAMAAENKYNPLCRVELFEVTKFVHRAWPNELRVAAFDSEAIPYDMRK